MSQSTSFMRRAGQTLPASLCVSPVPSGLFRVGRLLHAALAHKGLAMMLVKVLRILTCSPYHPYDTGSWYNPQGAIRGICGMLRVEEMPPRLDDKSDSERVQVIAPRSLLRRILAWRQKQDPIPSVSAAFRILAEKALDREEKRH